MKRKEFLPQHNFGTYSVAKEMFIQKDLPFKNILNQLKIKIMKLQSNNLLENLTNSEIENLALVVKETVSKEFKNGKKRTFSVAQFWDIQRRKRNVSSRRFAF